MRCILCVPCKLDTFSALTLSRPVSVPAPCCPPPIPYSPRYGELTTKPTEADIKAINDKAKAAEPEAVADAAPADDEPRVVELKDEPKKDAKLTQRKSSAAKDID